MITEWQRLSELPEDDTKRKLLPDTIRVWDKSPEKDDVHVVNEIHTWKDAKVRIFLKSRDVIHSFFLPNLRLKQDALPGKTVQVWFEATEANIEWDADRQTWKPFGASWDEEKHKYDKELRNWDLACAELCGWGHSKMQGKLFVHKDYSDYLKWLELASKNEASREARDADKPKKD
jgi:cytochrome c oxidase subunit 2